MRELGGEQPSCEGRAERVFLVSQVPDHADAEVSFRWWLALHRFGGLVDDAGLCAVAGYQLFGALLLQDDQSLRQLQRLSGCLVRAYVPVEVGAGENHYKGTLGACGGVASYGGVAAAGVQCDHQIRLLAAPALLQQYLVV